MPMECMRTTAVLSHCSNGPNHDFSQLQNLQKNKEHTQQHSTCTDHFSWDDISFSLSGKISPKCKRPRKDALSARIVELQETFKNIPPVLYFSPSSVTFDGIGVYAAKQLPTGTKLGPYTGRKVYIVKKQLDNHSSRESLWQVYEDTSLAYFIDARDPSYGNWMSFIQCARNNQEQNLKALQYNDCLYFEAMRDIAVNEELLVWYDNGQYVVHIGIPVGVKGSVTVEGSHQLGMIDQTLSEDNPYSGRKGNISTTAQPLQQEGNSSTTAQPLQQEGSTSTTVQPLQQEGNISTTVEPLQQEGKTTTTAKPLQQEGKTSTTVQPLQQEGNISTTVQPLQQEDSGIGMNINIESTSVTKVRVFKQLSSAPSSIGLKHNTPIVTTKHNYLNLFTMIELEDGKHWQCNVCKKLLRARGSLPAHARIHTGERPHKCQYCCKSFRQASTLRNHERLHTGEKPYKCDYCGRAFTQSASLRAHLKTH